MDEPWRAQEARNQLGFRAQNEAVLTGAGRRQHRRSRHEFVCECGDAACSEPILLTMLEYEAVRVHGRRFAVALDHEDPEVERVVAEEATHAIEKLPGPYGRLAMATTPA